MAKPEMVEIKLKAGRGKIWAWVGDQLLGTAITLPDGAIVIRPLHPAFRLP